MRISARLVGVAVVAMGALMASSAFAGDKLKADGLPYSNDVTIEGIKEVVVDGVKQAKLATRIMGKERFFELSTVEWIELEGQPNFNKAEDNRKKDVKAAVTAYKAAMGNINERKLKMLAELRSVEPLDQDGQYSNAVVAFLNVYATFPLEGVWKLRPVNMPAEGSTMLRDAVGKIEGKLPSFSAVAVAEAKRNLEVWQLELMTKAKDPRAAALAAKLGGAPADSVSTKTAQTPVAPVAPPVSGKGLEAIDNAIKAKQYDVAIALADKELPMVVGAGSAIQLFTLKVRAYEGKGGDQDLELAAATLLRIPAHYPSSQDAPKALLKAAKLQMQLKREDEARRLYHAILDDYPNSAEVREVPAGMRNRQ